MSQFLKQSTATTIMFGPFVDKTDGVTLETGAGIITSIDHATTGIFLSKAGGTAAIRHQTVTASVLDAYGMFKVTLDTTDTGTVGTLDVLMAEAATFLPVHKTFMVLPANVYDALMGTDYLQVDMKQVEGADATDTIIGADSDTLETLSDQIDTIPTTAMRGTDNAALASAWTAALATALGSYTAARAGYLDELAAANLPTDVAANATAIAALNDISVADIIAGVADGSYDLQEMIRIIFAACALKSSGGGTTEVKFRNSADDTDRITATVDSDGNRTTVTLDGS